MIYTTRKIKHIAGEEKNVYITNPTKVDEEVRARLKEIYDGSKENPNTIKDHFTNKYGQYTVQHTEMKVEDIQGMELGRLLRFGKHRQGPIDGWQPEDLSI